jgi:hypothetical protein
MQHRRRPLQPVHPFGPLLLGILALSILWPLHHFFGVGESIYELAIAAGLLYGGVIVVTFAIAGLVWGVIKLFGSRK